MKRCMRLMIDFSVLCSGFTCFWLYANGENCYEEMKMDEIDDWDG